MSNKILVTDSMFIKAHHVQKLEQAGFEVVRLDKSSATEAELCEAIKGKVGYILGGIEHVTDAVIEASDSLRAIVVTATGYKGFITGYKLAMDKGIALATAPHKNAHAVADFGMAMSLMMTRDVIALARGGDKVLKTTQSLSELAVGIVGMGHIGSIYAKMAQGMGVTEMSYFSRTRKPEIEVDLGVTYKDKAALLRESDLIFVTLPIDVGEKFFTAEDIKSVRANSIIVSDSSPEQFDLDALYARLEAGELRAAFDDNIKEDRFQALSLSTFYAPTESAAFNTSQAAEAVSDSCVETIINLLKTGEDQYEVN